ncbi:MAG: LPS assembly protein LptD [Gammaproteobacteria bacterium]|nr:LPS assembly protein LptD [Gammaproteobacteria bacterium]
MLLSKLSHRPLLALSAIVLSLLGSPVRATPSAQSNWSLCSYHGALPEWSKSVASDGLTTFNADQAEVSSKGLYNLLGTVRIAKDGQYLSSEQAHYNRDLDQFQANGAIDYWRDNIYLRSTGATLDLGKQSGHLEGVSFALNSRHARGDAIRAALVDANTTILDDIRYTTCDPGNNTWWLHANQLTLDHKEGIGYARHVWVSINQAPVFYFPWMSFPISDQRKTGFLVPEIRVSDLSGLELKTPYYFNIAPNYDLTVSPRLLEKRGTLVENEFRYLSRHAHGDIRAEYLNSDAMMGVDRSYFSYHHSGQFNNLSTTLEYNKVSDPHYFEHFGNGLGITSITHLPQSLFIGYRKHPIEASTLIQTYQTVDPSIVSASRPYQRLPQLQLNVIPAHNNGLTFKFGSEYVQFVQPVLPDGQRLHLSTELGKSYGNEAWFLMPSLQLNHTIYNVEGSPDELSRTVPIFSVDSGVFLDRFIKRNQDTKWLQTLEPRLYYLYAPFTNQLNLPVFDTGLPELSYTQMFRNNRFSGNDRIGDANQVTMAATSRLREQDSGRTLLLASMGNIYYFEDRRVTLPGLPAETFSQSDLLAQVEYTPASTLAITATTNIDVTTERPRMGGGQLRYRPNERTALNIGYRYRMNILEQGDAAIMLPLGPNWSVLGRWNYSYLENQVLETLGGVEYNSCCWAMRLIARRYLINSIGDINDAVYFQIELKGLTSFGQHIDNLLENGMLGFPAN